jgi:hypothetical protein
MEIRGDLAGIALARLGPGVTKISEFSISDIEIPSMNSILSM